RVLLAAGGPRPAVTPAEEDLQRVQADEAVRVVVRAGAQVGEGLGRDPAAAQLDARHRLALQDQAAPAGARQLPGAPAAGRPAAEEDGLDLAHQAPPADRRPAERERACPCPLPGTTGGHYTLPRGRRKGVPAAPQGRAMATEGTVTDAGVSARPVAA